MPPTEHLHARRLFELEVCLPILRRAEGREPIRLLEVGAGTGFQARILAEAGFEVSAVEIESSPYRNERVFPVLDYDGSRLPFADGSFDVVFSSNVLEHIPQVDQFLGEVQRVLAPQGICVHVLPTTSWRLWSMLTHYPWIIKRLMMLLTGRKVVSAMGSRAPKVPRSATGWAETLFPARHGEHGNALTEAIHFSAATWRKRFRKSGFVELEERPAGLFYTNAALFGGSLPVAFRQRLARLFGSACRIYVLRKA